MDYYRRSIEIILKNQHRHGAYIASPTFSNYHYCWLRDGSFTAYAMDRVGEHQSAEAYFRWVDRVINKHAFKVKNLEDRLKKGLFSPHNSILHARYTLEGEEEGADSVWGNFQIDGYGTWLWALAEHVQLTGTAAILSEFADSIDVTVRYLNAIWHLPNYDCWEEHPEFLHPYSLSAVYGGMNALAGLAAASQLPRGFSPALAPTEVKDFLCRYARMEDKFVKHVWPASEKQSPRPVEKSGVDASLLGLVVPYQVFALDDPMVVSTLEAIESELHRPQGGVYRYIGDVYYGGGEWLLLSAWLGWYDAQRGETERARELLHWIEKNADPMGNMPEQVNEHVLAPKEFLPWVERWGAVAKPLLWSHAMYLILAEELKGAADKAR